MKEIYLVEFQNTTRIIHISITFQVFKKKIISINLRKKHILVFQKKYRKRTQIKESSIEGQKYMYILKEAEKYIFLEIYSDELFWKIIHGEEP